MPKVVDHDERRRLVARTAADLVAAGGVEALTTRNVAEAAGYSTAVVSHYFVDKDDLLLATFQFASDRSRDRFTAATDRPATDPAQRLERGLDALLAITTEQRDDWRVFLAFWGTAATRPDLAAQQAARVRSAYERVAALLRQDDDLRLRGEALVNAARRLIVTVQGIATYAAFDQEDWPAARQRRVLADELADVRARARTAAVGRRQRDR